MYAITIGSIFTSIIAVVFLSWIVKLLNWVWFKPKKLEKILRKQGLNGKPYRPFLGDLKDMVTTIEAEQPRSIKLSDHTLPHIFPYHHHILAKYGQNSFFWLGPWPRLNIMDPILIKEILGRPNVFQKPLPETGKTLIGGGGVLFHEGEKWAKHRKIINPSFHLEKLKNMVPTIGLSCSNMIEQWETMVSSNEEGCKEIDVWPYLEDLTGDVISRTAFGSSHEEGMRIFQLQRDKVKLGLQLFKLSFIPGWRYIPTKLNRRMKAISNELQSLVRGIIEKRHKAIESGEANTTSDDLLGILLETNSNEMKGERNKGMSIEEVIEECKLFYIAGSETTSSLLVWTMVLLANHPQWQTQAREEIFRVFGSSTPNFEGLNHLKTMTMILQEVMRLYPPGPILERGTTETTKLGNLTLPAGVHLSVLIGHLHYDPEIWGDDAKEFKPQRFSEGFVNAAKIQSSFVPFSSGPRVCIGQNFAMIEAKMALSMILQRFSFKLSPSYLHSPFSVLTLRPQYGAPLILHSIRSQSVSSCYKVI